MNNKSGFCAYCALLFAVFFGVAVMPGRAQTNQALSAETTTTTTDQVGVVEQIHDTISDYVKEKAEGLDQNLDELLTPKELERSRTFDRFFGDRRREDDAQRTRLRIVPKMEWSEAEGVDFKFKFSLKLDLPRVKDRIQLVADNLGEDRNALTAFSESVSRPERIDGDEDTSISLRALLGERFNIRFTGDLGLKFRPEPVPKIRLKARLPWEIGNWQIRLREALFWEGEDGFGEKTSLDFERVLGALTSIEFSSAAVWSETSQGVDLGQSVSLSYFPGDGHSLGLNLGVKAHTDPTVDVDRYLVRCPLSRRTKRDWIYFIVEPGVDFPADRNYKFSPLIIFKLKFIFGDLPKES